MKLIIILIIVLMLSGCAEEIETTGIEYLNMSAEEYQLFADNLNLWESNIARHAKCFNKYFAYTVFTQEELFKKCGNDSYYQEQRIYWEREFLKRIVND